MKKKIVFLTSALIMAAVSMWGCGSDGNSAYKGAGRCNLPEHQESGFVCTGGRGVEPDPFHRR